MTVSYTKDVTTSTGLGCFLKLLGRWRGSIYKIVWPNLLLFLGIYYGLNFIYLYALDATWKGYFERMVTYCAKYGGLIPLSFVLGFYVNIVYTRWWSQYTYLPFPDNLAILVAATIKGQDDRARVVRRTIVRYACLTFTLTLTMMSPKVKKRFPTLNHLVEAGLMTPQEKNLLEQIDNDFPPYSKYWLPLAWAASVTTRARHEGEITTDLGMKGILDELNGFRTNCGRLLDFDWISIPLVYTQVVTLAVYGYFLVTVIGYQFISETTDLKEIIIFSFPFMPIIEFFFYVGWLKVAETLINPFGTDDDDFEVVWMIDRHIQVCFLLVDKIHQDHPTLGKDAYWVQTAPSILPFTVASQEYMRECPEWSTEYMHVKNTDQDFIIPEYVTQKYVFQGDSQKSDAPLSIILGRELWKRLFVRKGSGIGGFQLKRVGGHVDDSDIDEINSYEQSGPNKVNISPLNRPRTEHSDEFEKLRKERLISRKEKLLKSIDLLKLDAEERKKIIDDLVK
ncbi:bestrophin-2 isoform X2 [Anoplophora glabripennis]|uniref:bestrophin-2 isoform X2 n=1 Tax=Anoplophora glabripennis TaxID=217634 RepID=UPI000873AC26|nr:bestrophin-2 isoform X2 [Anoplophora glabripennis]